jgi:hypothetical protein
MLQPVLQYVVPQTLNLLDAPLLLGELRRAPDDAQLSQVRVSRVGIRPVRIAGP